MLELDEGKLSRPVLRRGDGSNTGSLAGGHAIPTGSTVPTLLNVELMDGQEVFGRCADGVTSQPHAGYPRRVTENIGHLGKVRQPPILGLQALSPGRPNQVVLENSNVEKLASNQYLLVQSCSK